MKKSILLLCAALVLLFNFDALAVSYLYSSGGGKLQKYNAETGEYIGVFATASGQGIVKGPDDNFYIASGGVSRYSNVTGDFIDVFASHPSINNAVDLGFGPDGNLYVTSHLTSEIYRFNGSTGAYIDVFANSSSGLSGPTGLTFGPDGKLYVSSHWNSKILRYNISTKQGEVLVNYIKNPHDLVFGLDDILYACALNDGKIYRYDLSGNNIGNLNSNGTVTNPYGLAFDDNGDLFIADRQRISRYDGTEFTEFAPSGSGETIYAQFIVLQDETPELIPEPLSIIMLASSVTVFFSARRKRIKK